MSLKQNIFWPNVLAPSRDIKQNIHVPQKVGQFFFCKRLAPIFFLQLISFGLIALSVGKKLGNLDGEVCLYKSCVDDLNAATVKLRTTMRCGYGG